MGILIPVTSVSAVEVGGLFRLNHSDSGFDRFILYHLTDEIILLRRKKYKEPVIELIFILRNFSEEGSSSLYQLLSHRV